MPPCSRCTSDSTRDFVPNDPPQGIWLGTRSGFVLHLSNFSHEPVAGTL
jgi:hypothetical protein